MRLGLTLTLETAQVQYFEMRRTWHGQESLHVLPITVTLQSPDRDLGHPGNLKHFARN